MATYKPNLRDAILQGAISGTCVGVFLSIDSISKPVAIGTAIVVSTIVFLLARTILAKLLDGANNE